MDKPKKSGEDHSGDCGCGDKSRRDFVKNMAAVTAGAMVLGPLAGCSDPAEPEMLVGTLDEIKSKGFLSPKFNGKRIFATLIDDEVVIFSMICRHKKCTVEWKETQEQFQCPCHDSLYDKEGYVLDGPPPGPLYRFKNEIRENGEVWVLNEFLAA